MFPNHVLLFVLKYLYLVEKTISLETSNIQLLQFTYFFLKKLYTTNHLKLSGKGKHMSHKRPCDFLFNISATNKIIKIMNLRCSRRGLGVPSQKYFSFSVQQIQLVFANRQTHTQSKTFFYLYRYNEKICLYSITSIKIRFFSHQLIKQPSSEN